MAILLSIYTENAFREIRLPIINNLDYSITLNKNIYGIKKDITLKLQVINEEWQFLDSLEYSIYKEAEEYEKKTIRDKDILKVYTESEIITIVVKRMNMAFAPFTKYQIDNMSIINIGKSESNDICYDYAGLVSREHAVLQRRGRDWYIINKSKNGIYINSVLVQENAKLQFGDYISIIGLHLVFLGDILAIDEIRSNVTISKSLIHHKPEIIENENKNEAGYRNQADGRVLVQRAPRNVEKIETEPIEIESPPGIGKTKDRPLFMIIGPSFTMAIPMMFSCMIMASSRSGAMMYTGLIMALSSAVIGVFWALYNLRYQKKEERERELHRFEAYGRYLQQKSDEVKLKYENNATAMHIMYESAEDCTQYLSNISKLWNRNSRHGDFLSPRLGIGNIEFQVPIKCDKKKFTLDEDSLLEKPRLIQENFKMLYDVPVCWNLLDKHLIGIVGGQYNAGGIEIVKCLATQIAANNCYTDVKMIFIYDGSVAENMNRFDFAKWLPHVWSEDKKMRYVAADKNEASDIFYSLAKTFRFRDENSNKGNTLYKPYFVMFLMNPELMEGELVAKYVLDMHNDYGITTFILADEVQNLPNECEYIIQNDDSFKGIYNLVSNEKNNYLEVKFDSISDEKVEEFARNLSNYYVKEIETGGDIPNAITFMEMYDATRLSDLNVLDRWRKNRTYENIKGMIGQKAGGAPCFLDLHEKYHGPHGLVAGTTGSGKSETLQTYMLSLALNYSPDDIGFFVIDYKGGGMANLFTGLPHLIGQISNLSGNQVHRAMVSIKSENRRRQRIFNEYDVNNINLYTKLYKNKEASIPIPHLFIIIDEFAELKREEPDFMRELISVAQVGRSLGVHLILATQKPSGTVDDNIWSNSKFRLCLRVQDRQDSMDMLHKPDAAYITQAGRCYLQVGNDEVFELFQSGFSGAAYEEDEDEAKVDIAKIYTLNGKVDMAGSYAKISRKERLLIEWLSVLEDNLLRSLDSLNFELLSCTSKSKLQLVIEKMYENFEVDNVDYARSDYNTARIEDFVKLYIQADSMEGENVLEVMRLAAIGKVKLPQAKEKTQLDAVKEYLAEIARDNGYTHELQLWMPVLPEKIYLSDFQENKNAMFCDGVWPEHNEGWNLDIVVGKFDDPKNQAQMPMHINFSEGGSLGIYGIVVSGKSTAVQTIVYALLSKYNPDYIWFYGIDFSSKSMSCFEKAPHCGGVMYEGEYEKISKFFVMLDGILKQRKKILRGGNYSQYVQVNGVTMPAIIVAIDNFGAFNQKTEEKYMDFLITLSKEGVSHGIFLLVSGGGISMADVPSRVAENVLQNITMEMQDKFAYSDIFHSVRTQVIPESGVKGRGLALSGSEILEYQMALALEASDDYQRIERITDICIEMAKAWAGKTARQIPEIPAKPVWSEFHELDDYTTMLSEPDCLTVGYKCSDALLYGINLRDTYCYLISGSPRSGKKNFLKVVLQAAIDKDASISIIDSPDKILKSYADENITYISTDEEIFNYLNELAPEFIRRNKIKNELVNQDADDSEIFDVLAKEKPMFIFISDFAWFIECIYDSEYEMTGFLENIIEKGRLHNIYFIAQMKAERKNDVEYKSIYELFTGYKTGMYFGGNVGDCKIFDFDSVPYKEQSEILKPGIGYAAGVMPTDIMKVVVPIARR
ncbi:MAG: type VII secretion protein EssC [Agathobacter sp.]|nr:type VII secretion protein EssC [Agathobacter sp.]